MKKTLFILISLIPSVQLFSQPLPDEVVPAEYQGQHVNKTITALKSNKGFTVKNGLFFINSFYESRSSKELSALDKSSARYLSKTFIANIDDASAYYFAAHVLPANMPNYGNDETNTLNLQKIRVYVNDDFAGTLKTSKAEWELVPLREKQQITLKAGENQIRFESNVPYYPEIDAIRLTKSPDDLIVENTGYNNFLKDLKAKSETGVQATETTRKLSQEEVDRLAAKLSTGKNTVQPKSAYVPDSLQNSWQVTPARLSNPEGIYQHRVRVPITFTYYRKLSLSAGTYTFHTQPIDGDTYYTVDPVMYLFNIDDPHNYSFYNDDTDGLHSRITATVSAGDYYLVVRAYSGSYASSELGRQGLVDVFQGGTLLNSGMPVAGYMFSVDSPNTGLVEYFTGYSTGIPLIWLQENSEKKMKFRGATYWYISPMDYYWFDDARLRLNKPSANDRYSMLVSAEGAMGFYFGNCDAYGSCPGVDSNVLSSFPNLKNNDAIKSANSSSIYNCTSWAGGITNGWFWGSLYSSGGSGSVIGLEYGSPYVWATWDNYFGNNPARYSGAVTYTRDQADASNAVIAMWSSNGTIGGVTHASVRLDGNNHPHGYDWESKAGSLCRFFHPKDALAGSSYGSIFAYYRDASKDPYPYYAYSTDKNEENAKRNTLLVKSVARNLPDSTFTFEESVKRGLTVIEKVELDADQQKAVQSRIKTLKAKSGLDTLYAKWVAEISADEFKSVSNPYVFIETDEGQALLDYAKRNLTESVIFFAHKIFRDTQDENENFQKNISYILFCEIARDRYGDLMETIKKEWAGNSYTASGGYIAPLPETFTKKYMKQILDKEILKK